MAERAARGQKFILSGLDRDGAIVATALLLIFAFAIVFAGMWIVAAYTGFVGAIGHAGAHNGASGQQQLA